MKDGLLSIRVQISLGKYQDQLLKLGKKLESGLYGELVSEPSSKTFLNRVKKLGEVAGVKPIHLHKLRIKLVTLAMPYENVSLFLQPFFFSSSSLFVIKTYYSNLN